MTNEIVNIRYEEEFILNSRGLKMFTCKWLPTDCEPKALVFLCHGYAMECSISMKDTGVRLAKAGYAVHGMDYEGHGKSSGLAGYVPSFDDLVNDLSEHYSNVCETKENLKKMRILLGESMGGAVALLLHRKKPEYWDGAVLVAPMCKGKDIGVYFSLEMAKNPNMYYRIADEMKPHPIVINVLTKLSYVIPTWKIIPTQDVIDAAFRRPEVRDEVRANPYCYKGRPRLKTGYHLLKVSMELEQRLDEVSLPFLVLHGGEDKVTDPSVSKLLHETAASTDKTFKLYPGMWHSLTYGELPENIDRVFSDVIGWLDERSSVGNSRLENEQKLANDGFYSKFDDSGSGNN